MARKLTYAGAINEALDQCLSRHANVYLMGLGVPDAKGVFGTTTKLQEKHGAGRVMDMPAAENGMTGIAIGSALSGMKPILVHQRLDFALLSVDQLVNQAAKWYYMFGGKQAVPLVVRMIVGRGWGQGSQHAQSLQSWFAHVPGLKVIMPATPYDAKGMLIAAVEDNNPVICIEHRWLFNIAGPVPEEYYQVPLGQARVLRQGSDATIVAISHMTIEAVRAAELLAEKGIEVEVIDVRTLRPLDEATILKSIRKTGRLVVADTGWKRCGMSAEVMAVAAENAWGALQAPPQRVTLAECPSPSTPALARYFFPSVSDLVRAVCETLDRSPFAVPESKLPIDVPDNAFAGPF